MDGWTVPASMHSVGAFIDHVSDVPPTFVPSRLFDGTTSFSVFEKPKREFESRQGHLKNVSCPVAVIINGTTTSCGSHPEPHSGDNDDVFYLRLLFAQTPDRMLPGTFRGA
jgi:hypothetical protein